jgi:1-acyl-sn-glycerol-3-phosphate acyltransferase
MTDGGLLLRLLRAVLFVAATFALAPIQGALLLFKAPLSRRFPRYFHRVGCRILGFRIETVGQPSQRHPTLFVANHSSYIDVPVLGSLVDASFVAKAEIASWPFFGMLAKLQRSIFVDRRPGTTGKQRDALVRRLEEGDDIIIFPEATSSDGIHMLPFKSALLSVAELRPHGQALAVQPVTVAYLRLDGMPMGRFFRPFVAWYGGMEVVPHLWTMLGLGTLTFRVIFHPVVTLDQFGSRKDLAVHCYKVIHGGLAASLAGRGPDAEAEAQDEDEESMAEVE